MRRIVLTIAMCLYMVGANAFDYYSINIDYKTFAEMTAAYASEVAVESYYTQQTDKILEHYEAAEVATAGIYASKLLDRKALTNLDGWDSSTENYYYQRIYNMVSRKIMPKMWDVAGLMIKDPTSAIYWGNYLLKTTNEVKALCLQFQGIVTDGRLTFNDIAFLELNDNIKSIVKLSELGGVNWQNIFDNLSAENQDMDVSDLKKDISTLYSMGVGLANSGWSGMVDGLTKNSKFNSTFMAKINTVQSIAYSYTNMFDHFEGGIGQSIASMVGNSVGSLFKTGSINGSAWQSDYANSTDDTYYTQRWYIYEKDEGSIILCNYVPDVNNLSKGEWYKVKTNSKNYYPTLAEKESILKNSESYAGWSRQKVNELKASGDGCTYTFATQLYDSSVNISATIFGFLSYKFFAYGIEVTKSWSRKNVVYEETFDSYKMDLETFKKQMQIKVDELNQNEGGKVYYLGADSKRTYAKSDAEKTKGAQTATISVSCNNGVNFGEGSTQYKCGSCGSSVNDHTRECSMQTTIHDGGLGTSDIDAQIKETEDNISVLQSKIESIDKEQQEIVAKMRYASTEAPTLRQRFNQLSDEKSELKLELQEAESTLKQLQSAREEIINGEQSQTDDYYRIPAIMNDLKNAYRLTWNDEGKWSGNTYTRTASIPGVNGTVAFTADINIVRKPKYFMGVKIHRAIVGITWKLTGKYGDAEVVDMVTLDSSKSDEDKAEEVNQHIQQVKEDYPDCDVSVAYNKAKGSEDTDGEDTQHLLWSSDRLSIASEIDTRLTKIYASLVCYEKMMFYKHSIVDYVKYNMPQLENDKGRKHTLAQECKDRWLINARKRRIK